MVRKIGTKIFEEFRAFCRKEKIPFQAVNSESVANLSRYYWLTFSKENEVIIYGLANQVRKRYEVKNLNELLFVLCDYNYKIMPLKYLPAGIIGHPLYHYETFNKPMASASSTIQNVNIYYSYK